METVIIKTRCPFCGASNKPLEVDAQAYERWQDGELVQNAFPNMSVDDRELLITGICNKCFPS